MEYFIKKFNELTLEELYEIIKLRIEVFVVEQNSVYQDLDDKDQLSYHLFLKDDDEIVAVLRIIPENLSNDEMTIGRVIVKKSHRKQGISKVLMKNAIDFIIGDLGKNKIRLSGQSYLTDYYIDLGFKRVSDEYLKEGRMHFDFLYEV